MSPDFYMQKALDLAGQGLGTTWPNPMVGAVLVKNGKIIGEGFHHRSGENHAEINALIKLDYNNPKKKTLYITLSPCKQCAKAIINGGIDRVVYRDTYRCTSGIELLREHNIETIHFSSL